MEKTSSHPLKPTDPDQIIKLRQVLLGIPLLNSALQACGDPAENGWLQIFPVSMGYSNSSYRIETPNKKYILRIDTSAKNLFQCDRQLELTILKEAEKLNIAPKVVYSDIDQGILITEYIEGRLLHQTDLTRPVIANSLNQLLDDISMISVDTRARLLHKTIGYYWQLIVPVLKEYAQLSRVRKQLQPLIIDLSMQQQHYEICHNDLGKGNLILQDDHHIVALDWEYAALSHPLLDFAIFANAWDLTNLQLTEMFPQKFYKMDFDWHQMRKLATFIEALWYAIRVTREPFGPWENLLNHQMSKLSSY